MKAKTEKMYVVTHLDDNKDLLDEHYEYINVKSLYPTMNRIWNEWCAMDYVYKNNIHSDFIGFCHYRRIPNKDVLNDNIASKSIQYFNRIKWDYFLSYDDELSWLTYYFNRLSAPTFIVEDVKEYIEEQSILPKTELKSYFSANPFIYYNRTIFYTNWDIFCELYEFINAYLDFIKKKYNIQSDNDWIEHIKQKIISSYRKKIHTLHKESDGSIALCWNGVSHFMNICNEDYGWGAHLNCWRLYAYMIEALVGSFINHHKPNIEGYENSSFITYEHAVDIYW